MRISFLEGNSRFLSAGLSLNKPSPHQQIVEFMSYKIISFDAANPVSLYNGIRETKPTGKHRTCPVPEVPRHDTTRHDTTRHSPSTNVKLQNPLRGISYQVCGLCTFTGKCCLHVLRDQSRTNL